MANVKRELSDIVGRWAWDAFPADPETVRQFVASFERVIQTNQPDTMAVIRFNIPCPEAEGGGFVERYWSITHSPVLNENGEVLWVLQCKRGDEARLSSRAVDVLVNLEHGASGWRYGRH